MTNAKHDQGAGGQPVEFDPFAAGELECTVASTAAQREMWASLELGGEDASRGYNESVRIRLRGPLNVDAFRASLRDLVARHQALRATFTPDGAVMCIAGTGDLDAKLVDLRGLSDLDREKRLEQLIEREAYDVFDLLNGPLVRASLVRTQEQEHWFFFTAHHIVCDGWSTAVVLAELGTLYSAKIAGVAAELPPAGSFSEYALRENAFVAGPDVAPIAAYWQERFRGTAPILDFPTDKPRPQVRSFRASRVDHELDVALMKRLKDLARKNGVSYVVMLTAAFQTFVHRLTGQGDLVVAVPTAGQALLGEHNLIGHCVNTLPVRTPVDGDGPFVDFLRTVRTAMLDAYENQQLTFGSIVNLLKVPRDPSRIPLAPVVFNVDTGIDNFEFTGLEGAFFSNPRMAENFEINVNASETKHGMTLECTFNSDLHTPERMRARMAEFEVLLRGIADDVNAAVGSLPILPADEQRAVLVEWNATARAVPETTIHGLIEARADAHPEKVAVRSENVSLTYRELEERANRLAHFLAARGVRRGSLVGLCLRRNERVPVAILAISKAGGAYVPIDPDYPADRLRYILEDAGAKLIVTETALLRDIPPLSGMELVDLDRDSAAIDRALSSRPLAGATPDDLVYIIHTSGSTGQPKGVPIHHRASVNLVQSMQREPGMTDRDVLVAVVTLSFDMSTYEIFTSLASGATCVMVSRDVTLDGDALGRELDRVEATVMQATPVTWRMLVDSGWRGRRTLKALTGGEALSPELASALLARVGELWNCYGPTETTVYSTAHRVTSPEPPILIGRPVDNTRTYVLDRRQRPVPVGVVGELYLGGMGLARGYLNRPDLTNERFFADPFASEPGARMYRAGDLARWTPDGRIQCLNRVDNQVKIRGYRIELGEIESALRACAGVRDAVVHAWEVAGGERELAAYLLVDANRPVDAESIRAQLRGSLPTFMVPPHVSTMTEFPLTPNGKVDRKALPRPSSGQERVVTGSRGGEKPRTPVEEVLMDVWEEVLGRRPGLFDNFFDLGGHSLQALRVIDAAHKRGLSLRPTDLFKHPTVESLAQAAGFRTPAGSDAEGALIALQDKGTRPPLFFLHSLPGDLLHFGPLVQRLGLDQPCYGFQALGLDDEELTDWTVENLAAHYVDVLKKWQPSGPYHLAGWCYGGSVAVEMARVLRSRGDKVGLVALMETWPAREQKQQLVYTAKSLLTMGRKALPAVREKLRKIAGNDTVMDPLEVFALDVDSGPFRNRTKVYARNIEANQRQRTHFYPGELTLFEAGIKPVDQVDAKDYGWREFASSVKTYFVNARHEDILKAPHVDVLAKQLTDALAAANRKF